MAYQDVGSMRAAISKVYRGPAWRRKVSWMSDNQIIAVYYSFLEKGKFDDVKRMKECSNASKKERSSTCEDVHQITFDELLHAM